MYTHISMSDSDSSCGATLGDDRPFGLSDDRDSLHLAENLRYYNHDTAYEVRNPDGEMSDVCWYFVKQCGSLCIMKEKTSSDYKKFHTVLLQWWNDREAFVDLPDGRHLAISPMRNLEGDITRWHAIDDNEKPSMVSLQEMNILISVGSITLKDIQVSDTDMVIVDRSDDSTRQTASSYFHHPHLYISTCLKNDTHSLLRLLFGYIVVIDDESIRFNEISIRGMYV